MAAERAAPPRIPATILTGYAGAGKSHVVNLLLAEAARRKLRVAVVAQRAAEEFALSPNPIRADLAVAYTEVYDFGSGCLCCSPRGEMTRALAELARERRDAVDHVVVRCGPLAAPLVFAKALLCSDDAVASTFELASIVAVVDPSLAPRHLAPTSEEWQAREQLRCADLALLNFRGDERDEPLEADLRSMVDAIQPGLECVRASATTSIIDVVLGRRGFDLARAKAIDPSLEDADDSPGAVVTLRGHDRRLAAAAAVADGGVLEHKLLAMLEPLRGGQLLRVKGVVRLRAPLAEPPAADEWLLLDGAEGALDVRRVLSGAPELRLMQWAATGGDDDESARAAAAAPSKLFVLYRGALQVGTLRERFHDCRVPDGFVQVADAELDFGRLADVGQDVAVCRTCGDVNVVVIRASRAYYVVDAAQPALARPLNDGAVSLIGAGVAGDADGATLRCELASGGTATFRLRDGGATDDGGAAPLRVRQVEVLDGAIYASTG